MPCFCWVASLACCSWPAQACSLDTVLTIPTRCRGAMDPMVALMGPCRMDRPTGGLTARIMGRCREHTGRRWPIMPPRRTIPRCITMDRHRRRLMRPDPHIQPRTERRIRSHTPHTDPHTRTLTGLPRPRHPRTVMATAGVLATMRCLRTLSMPLKPSPTRPLSFPNVSRGRHHLHPESPRHCAGFCPSCHP